MRSVVAARTGFGRSDAVARRWERIFGLAREDGSFLSQALAGRSRLPASDEVGWLGRDSTHAATSSRARIGRDPDNLRSVEGLEREIADRGEVSSGFFLALRDRRVRRALDLLHREPATPWTLDELAKQAVLSRATLVRRFRESVGLAPIEYLTRWRLLKAHRLASNSDDSIGRIASRVGFSSDQTLTRAFKRQFGITPSSLRR